MLGDNATTQNNRGNGSALAAAVPLVPPSNPSGSRRGQPSSQTTWTVWTLAIILGLLVTWGIIEQHEKVRGALKPQNIALNLLNVVKIALAAVVGIVTVKIALAKLASLKIPFVSMVAQYVGNVWGAA